MMKKIIVICFGLLCAAMASAQTVNPVQRTTGKMTMKGQPVTLLGRPAAVGEIAPDFTLTDKDMKPVRLSDFAGKTVILSVFPSVDTKVCAFQARRFNQEASSLGDDVVVLTISKDLPFALGRFCAAEGIDRIYTLSDYRESDFGLKYGFLMDENKLLGRGVVVVGKSGKIGYVEYVKEVGQEPDYVAAIEATKRAK